MCWSFEVSIITGAISYSIATYLWFRNYKNDRWHSIILFVFSSIQWMDAIIWNQYNNNLTDSELTKTVITFLIPLILALEPLASLYGADYIGKNVSKIDILIYGLIFISLFIIFRKNNSYPDVIKNNGIQYFQNEDSYNSFNYWIFGLMLVYPLMKYAGFSPFYLLLYGIVAIALIISQISSNTISTWCLYSNIVAVLFLFYPYIE